MQIIKPLSLSLIYRTLFQDRRYRLCISPLLFFSLSQQGKVIPEQLAWQKVMASLSEGEVLDAGAPKANAEVLVSGVAQAPAGVASDRIRIGFKVGNMVEKYAMVYGDQFWRLQGNTWRLSTVAPLSPTALSWANAYGGPGYADNPVGTGFLDDDAAAQADLIKLPNIRSENGDYVNFSRSRDGSAPCVAFGALDMTAPIRQQRAGTYDDDWLANDYPGLAHDHDPAIHNVAQSDQWLSGFLKGDEPFTISGMSSVAPAIHGKLPAMRARAFVQKTSATSDELFEVNLDMDTLWLFPEQDMGLLISRGQCDVEDSDSLDVQSLMIAYERQTDNARTLEYYRRVHKLRTDPDTALAHLMHEAQLVPIKTEAQLDQEASEVLAEKRKRQKKIEESLKPASQAVTEALQQQGVAALAELVPENTDVPQINKGQLTELMTKASKLAALNSTNGESPADAAYDPEKVADKLQAMPLEKWRTIKAAESDLSELVRTASRFAEQCQQDDQAGLISSEARLVDISARITEKLNGNMAITADSVKQLGIDVNDLTNAAQKLLGEYQAQGGTVAPADKIPAARIPGLEEQLKAMPASSPAAPAGVDINTLIAAIDEPVQQGAPRLKQDQQQEIFDEINQIPVITPEAIERADFDLSEVIAAANKKAQECELAGKDLLDKLDEKINKNKFETDLDDANNEAGNIIFLAEVESKLRQRFEPIKATEQMDVEALEQMENASRLGRTAAPSDSTDAKRFAAEVRDFLRARVISQINDHRPLTGLDLSGANLSGLDLSGQDLSGALFESADLSACNFRGANLDGAVLTAAKIDQACFDGCNFGAANLSGLKAKAVSFVGCNLTTARVVKSWFSGCDFSSTEFIQSVFQETKLDSCSLKDCVFHQVQWVSNSIENLSWTGSEFRQNIFVQSKINGADFSNASFQRCIFAEVEASASLFCGSTLDTVQFAGKCLLDGSNFSDCTGISVGLLGIDLSNCLFSGSAFKESNFSNCKFDQVDMNNAGFLRCVFSDASMHHVKAVSTNFMESLLRKSHWCDSDLSNGEFFNANVKQSVFEKCNLRDIRNMGSMIEVRL